MFGFVYQLWGGNMLLVINSYWICHIWWCFWSVSVTHPVVLRNKALVSMTVMLLCTCTVWSTSLRHLPLSPLRLRREKMTPLSCSWKKRSVCLSLCPFIRMQACKWHCARSCCVTMLSVYHFTLWKEGGRGRKCNDDQWKRNVERQTYNTNPILDIVGCVDACIEVVFLM